MPSNVCRRGVTACRPSPSPPLIPIPTPHPYPHPPSLPLIPIPHPHPRPSQLPACRLPRLRCPCLSLREEENSEDRYPASQATCGRGGGGDRSQSLACERIAGGVLRSGLRCCDRVGVGRVWYGRRGWRHGQRVGFSAYPLDHSSTVRMMIFPILHSNSIRSHPVSPPPRLSPFQPFGPFPFPSLSPSNPLDPGVGSRWGRMGRDGVGSSEMGPSDQMIDEKMIIATDVMRRRMESD